MNQTTLIQGPEHEQLLVFSNEYEKYGHHFTFYVAEDMQPSLNSVNHFINHIIVFMGFSLFVLIII